MVGAVDGDPQPPWTLDRSGESGETRPSFEMRVTARVTRSATQALPALSSARPCGERRPLPVIVRSGLPAGEMIVTEPLLTDSAPLVTQA